jgi:hypothetical protein
MPKKPKTVGEEIVSLYGHITGLKKDISHLKTNHLKHLSCSVYKIEKKVDNIIYWLNWWNGCFNYNIDKFIWTIYKII